MSRIRSQLDSILAGGTATAHANAIPPLASEGSGPRPAFAPRASRPAQQYAASHHGVPDPAPRQPNSAGQDLDALHRSLEQLSKKIASIPQASAPQPAQHAPVVSAPSGVQLDRMHDSVVSEIRSGFGDVHKELAYTGDQIGQIGTGVSQALSDDLQRISDGIAMLQENRNMHPDYIDQMQSELGALNAGINQLLANPVSQVDLSGVSAAIESNYSDLVNKLDSVLANRGSELPEINLPDYSKEFASLNNRLEEVTRAVVSLTVSPDNTNENHAFERIEARLASLSKSVDEIMEAGMADPTTDGAQTNTGFAETVSDQIARLSEKLDNLDAMGAAGKTLGSQIFPDVQELANRIDGLHRDFAALASNVESGFEKVATFNVQSDGKSTLPESVLSGIEQRLHELATRFDELSSGTGENPNASGQEILSALREVVSRIDTIEHRSAALAQSDGAAFDETRFADLENQLSGIAAQLGSFSIPEGSSGAPVDFAPITERLDHIEGQIATSRDIVIDIATEAAQRAVAAGGGEENSVAIASVLEEIRSLRADQQQSVVTQPADMSGDLENIGATMAAIADRLAQIEQSIQNSAVAVGEQSDPERFQQRDRQHTEMRGAPLMQTQSGPISPDFDLPDTRQLEEPNSFQEQELETIQDAPSIDMSVNGFEASENVDTAMAAEIPQARAEAEVEDVPLAPGSGMPDLEALVKRATSRKKGASEESESGKSSDTEGLSDLMAAARRAAQAASVEAESVRESTPKAKSGLRSKLPALSRPSFLNKKMLMMSAAVIAIAIGGVFLAPKFFGGSDVGNEVSVLDGVMESDSGMDDATQSDASGDRGGFSDGPRVVTDDMGENGDATQKTADASLLAPGSDTAPLQPPSDEAMEINGSSPADPAFSSVQDEIGSVDLPSEELGNLAFRKAVASGDGDALFEAGRRYTEGEVVPRDLKEAVSWYTKAAEAGHAPAQYRIGNFLEKGHGVEADPAAAADWYAKAAAQGNALAMHNLAVLNAMGVVNGDADMKAAIGWFEKAANLGVKDSQVNLGILYTKGMGVQEDIEKAYKWFAIAAKGGDSDAGKKRDTVAQAMRPEQLEKARGAAEIWKPASLDKAANIAQVREEWTPGGNEKAMSEAEMVRMTQSILSKAGYDPGPADGMMGEKTRNAIMSFQKANGLSADGNITPELMEALTKTSI